MDRRLVPALILAAALALAAGSRRPPRGAPPDAAPAVAPPAEVARVRPAAAPAPAPAPAASPHERAYREHVAAVAEGCGLEAVPRCSDATCVAVLEMPDLDRLTGWLELGARHPTFVASTIARDLGVPARTLPCGTAVAALVGEGTVRTVELPDGREVWCASDGDRDEADALCDALASDTLALDAAARFTDPDLRRLEFDRDR